MHCGFFNENGGFRISDEDNKFMQTCQVVVSTCAFGGGDNLYEPIGMSKASSQKVGHSDFALELFILHIMSLCALLNESLWMQVCYVAFWDEVTLAAQEEEGHKIGENGYIGKWRIVIVKDLPFMDQRLNGKIPKVLFHLLQRHTLLSLPRVSMIHERFNETMRLLDVVASPIPECQVLDMGRLQVAV